MMPLTIACMLAAAVPEARARIAVDAGVKGAPVSRNLFGKFTEHLGRNVYLGMWSQILPNPEFARTETFGDEGRTVAMRGRAAEEFGVTDSGGELAPFWWGDGHATVQATEHDGRDSHTRCAQQHR